MGTLTHEKIVPTKNKYIFGTITRDPKLILKFFLTSWNPSGFFFGSGQGPGPDNYDSKTVSLINSIY
jgi:hypothetical protein